MRHLRSLKMHTRFSRRCFRAETLFTPEWRTERQEPLFSSWSTAVVCCTTTQFPYTLNAVRTACTRSPRFMSESQRRAQKPFIIEQLTLMLLVACAGVLYPRSAASTRRQPGRCPECRGVVCTCWPLKQCLGEALMVLRASLLHTV